ncbi:hypothetical protein [Paenibacillus thalictri]|uniref:Heparinase n=1 Tax=Paenibacillus thalictri TaxID=2527873 RepID=A0A4Q9DYQ4_9BACL|nr:hypothetical protein [Paenibacillus thalictri]TBL81536.1 hypothetical protein EYB31_00535 [Paenibacillus thalictri]
MFTNHYSRIVRITEQFVPFILKYQCLDAHSREYGGNVSPPKAFSEPNTSAHCADVLLSLYYNTDSVYCGKPELLASARLYLDNLLREQHEDGTIDLKETNFHDATSVAFSVQVLGYTYKLVEKYSRHNEQEQDIRGMLLQFFRQSAKGMVEGGFHTPNHRWVMASALSLLTNILGEDQLKDEIQLYLNEGIDCDEQGEYTERSVGIYNVINNRSLLIMAEELAMPELLAHVERNLNMVLNYIEPDDTLFTLNSTRQDNGKESYPVNYFENYFLMAYRTNNKVYAHMSEYLLELTDRLVKKADSLRDMAATVPMPHYLTLCMLDEGLARYESDTEKPARDYEVWFADSGVVRRRADQTTMTIVGNNSTFLKFQYGTNKVYVKFAGTFFSKGQFKGERIEQTERGYSLHYRREWGYVRPFADGSPTNVWREMDHAAREKIQMQTYDMTVHITAEEQGICLEVVSEGIERLPCKLELIFEPGGEWETGDSIIPGEAGRSVILKSGAATYRRDGDDIRLQGGFGEHTYTTVMRGSETHSREKFTVYMTDFTPIDRRIIITAAGQGEGV